MLLKRDGFPYVETPTNDRHIAYLKSLPMVQGLSLNSNLYANNNEAEIPVQEPEVFKPPIRVQPKPLFDMTKPSFEIPTKSKLIRNDRFTSSNI